MKPMLALCCLLLVAGCGKEALPNLGLSRLDAVVQAQADVEKLTTRIKEENQALVEDAYLARRAEGEDKIKLEAIVEGDRTRLKQLQENKRAAEIRIRELMAERRSRGQ